MYGMRPASARCLSDGLRFEALLSVGEKASLSGNDDKCVAACEQAEMAVRAWAGSIAPPADNSIMCAYRYSSYDLFPDPDTAIVRKLCGRTCPVGGSACRRRRSTPCSTTQGLGPWRGRCYLTCRRGSGAASCAHQPGGTPIKCAPSTGP